MHILAHVLTIYRHTPAKTGALSTNHELFYHKMFYVYYSCLWYVTLFDFYYQAVKGMEDYVVYIKVYILYMYVQL